MNFDKQFDRETNSVWEGKSICEWERDYTFALHVEPEILHF